MVDEYLYLEVLTVHVKTHLLEKGCNLTSEMLTTPEALQTI